MRALFATSLAQVAQATGSAAVVMVADGLTGALKGWFDNRRAAQEQQRRAGQYLRAERRTGAKLPGAELSGAIRRDAGGYPMPE